MCSHFFSGILAPLCLLTKFAYELAFLLGQHKIRDKYTVIFSMRLNYTAL